MSTVNSTIGTVLRLIDTLTNFIEISFLDLIYLNFNYSIILTVAPSKML